MTQLKTPPWPALLLLSMLLNGCNPIEDIAVVDATLRPPLPGKTTTVAYFTLTNNSADPVTLVAASSPIAGAIEMHTHIHDGDMMRMRRVQHVDIASRTSVHFKSGSYHLMLFRVHDLKQPGNQPLNQQQVPITLQFKHHDPVTVMFTLEDY